MTLEARIYDIDKNNDPASALKSSFEADLQEWGYFPNDKKINHPSEADQKMPFRGGAANFYRAKTGIAMTAASPRASSSTPLEQLDVPGWSPEKYFHSVLGKNDKRKFLPMFIKRDKEFQQEFLNYDEEKNDPMEETVVILDWYTTATKNNKHTLKKLDRHCGSCWYTNDRNFEKSADGIVIDNGVFLSTHPTGSFYNPPELSNRTQNQYWIFYMRESPARFYKHTMNLNFEDEHGHKFDNSYNLSMSFRRDSDIEVHSTSKDIIHQIRYKDPGKWNSVLHSYGTLVDSNGLVVRDIKSSLF